MVWYGMVMVSINFAVLNPGIQGRLRPAGFPTRTPGYLISWAMATSLWPLALAFAFGDLLVPWPLEICLCRGQGPGHGAGRGHARRAGNGHEKDGHGTKPQAKSPGPKPWQSLQAMARGHGHGSGLKLMARET